MQNQLYELHKQLFSGKNELFAFFAPGRVNLIGEHTDYNGGHVFPCALNRGTYAVVSKRQDSKLCLYSNNFSQIGIIELDLIDELIPTPKHDWANYVKGMCKMFIDNGYLMPYGLNITVAGNIPNGAGLSSSASLEMLIATILNTVYQFNIPQLTLVKWGQNVENNFIGVSSGIMDQFASMMGKQNHAMLLNCDTLDYSYAPLNLNGYSIIIANTNKSRGLADSKYNERVTECQTALKQLKQKLDIKTLSDIDTDIFLANEYLITNPVHRLRALHAVTENRRTLDAAAALKNNDLGNFGELMNQSHISLRDNYAVTGIELDTLVESAWIENGTLGARMTGAGFGGCTVNIVKTDKADSFIHNVGNAYTEITGLSADFYIADVGTGARAL
jgi:galactokinase